MDISTMMNALIMQRHGRYASIPMNVSTILYVVITQ